MPKTRFSGLLWLIGIFVLITPVLTYSQQKNNFEFCLGVNYVSWRTGDYPYTTAWQTQTYHDSQGMVKADITDTKPYKGEGSLELTLEIKGKSETHRQGEVFVDLRYIPNYEAKAPIERSGKDNTIDLTGKTIGAVVFCPAGTAGPISAPSGIQLFAKSVETKDGKELWGSYYGNWHNIWKGTRYGRTALELGHVMEGEWSLVSMKIPQKDKLIEPFYGYMDPSFNPAKVALIGFKYALNRNATSINVAEKIWVDEFGWKNIIGTGNLDFEFYKLPHSKDVEVWNHFREPLAPPWSFEEDLILKKVSTTLKIEGNNVLFTFEDIEDPITSLKNSGYNIAAIVNTEYMETPDAVTIQPHSEKSHTDEELIALIQEMHSKGLRTMLKPHVDVADHSWRGHINPENKAEWFRAYTDFITRYARLAEDYNVEVLIIGTEFKSLIGDENRQEWENVIHSIRSVYSGVLTYAANWDSYQDVCLWDIVDIVGVDAYFPISFERDPSLAELVEGWSSWVRELAEFQKSVGKDILFTELGYRSIDYAAGEPWEYQEQRPANQELQANCYQAVIEALKDHPWFKGVLFWNWLPLKDSGGKFNTDFTPQHKLAEDVFLN